MRGERVGLEVGVVKGLKMLKVSISNGEDFGRESDRGNIVCSWGWASNIHDPSSTISKRDAIIALAHSIFNQSPSFPPSLPYLFYMEISVKTCLS